MDTPKVYSTCVHFTENHGSDASIVHSATEIRCMHGSYSGELQYLAVPGESLTQSQLGLALDTKKQFVDTKHP